VGAGEDVADSIVVLDLAADPRVDLTGACEYGLELVEHYDHGGADSILQFGEDRKAILERPGLTTSWRTRRIASSDAQRTNTYLRAAGKRA